MKIVLVSGGFDPLHSGHIRMFTEAKKLGDRLVVGVNSDAWLTRKKGRPFMPQAERVAVVRALSMVDAVVEFDADYDADGSCRRFVEDSCWNYEVDPGCSLSNQRHFNRSEYWLVSEGEATVDYQKHPAWNTQLTKKFGQHQALDIPCETWHRLYNKTDQPVRIIEIQYGKDCREEDIERKPV